MLTGELMDQDCVENEPSMPGPMPLEHRITLKVREVAGFEVKYFYEQLTGCEEQVVLPSEGRLSVPTARPIDAEGLVFDAFNAPTPMTITLRSPEPLSGDVSGFVAGPGEVEVALATELPVIGLESFTVVGPETLTELEATLHLQRTAAKGGFSEPIVEGASYPILFPDMINTVDVQVSAAMTELGRLCERVPREWFVATTSTPAQCVSWVDETWESLAVAKIEAAGGCSLEVAMPGTPFAWATKFVTEF